MTEPPPSPGRGLEWVELTDAMIEAEIEQALEDLALQVMRDPDRDLRMSAARDWSKVEEAVRSGYRQRFAAMQSRAAREADQLQ
jgi:hypothetical protein